MTVDACPQWRDDLGALAVGQLEPHRQLALLEHLDGCPSCREEAEELSYVVSLIPLTDVA